MTADNIETPQNGFSRRTLVKGAAWSLPVIAVAASTPLAAASPTPGLDVGVAASCEGNYNLDGLLGLINAIPLAGPLVGQTVQTLLAAVGLTPYVSRGFTITAVEGEIAAGTEFTLTTAPGLIDLGLLAGAIDASVLGIVSVNGDTSATVTLLQPLAEGQSTLISLPLAAVDLGLTGNAALALVGTDSPTVEPGAPNSASLELISLDTNLAALVPGVLDIPLVGALVGALTITVQFCPGQTAP